jgi:hypothetical protein
MQIEGDDTSCPALAGLAFSQGRGDICELLIGRAKQFDPVHCDKYLPDVLEEYRGIKERERRQAEEGPAGERPEILRPGQAAQGSGDRSVPPGTRTGQTAERAQEVGDAWLMHQASPGGPTAWKSLPSPYPFQMSRGIIYLVQTQIEN